MTRPDTMRLFMGFVRLVVLPCTLITVMQVAAAQTGDACPASVAGNPDQGECNIVQPATTAATGENNLRGGNPINIITGNKYQREVDMPALPGVLGLEIVREYNSALSGIGDRYGIMGRGWRLSYDTRLYRGKNFLQIEQADGTRLLFGMDFIQPGAYNNINTANGRVEITKTQHGEEFVWTWSNGRTLTFDGGGKLREIQAATGEKVVLAYNARGQLLKVTDPQQRSMQFDYSGAGPTDFQGVQAIDSPVGRFNYRYGSPVPAGARIDQGLLKANLTGVYVLTTYDPTKKLNDNLSRTYQYEDPAHPTRMTGMSALTTGPGGEQVNDRIATWRYNKDGKAVESAHANGVEKVILDYSKDGTTILSNSLGQNTTYKYAIIGGEYRLLESRGPGCASCGPSNERYEYDKAGARINTIRLGPNGEPVESRTTERDQFGRPWRVRRIAYIDGQAQPAQVRLRYAYAEQTPDAIPARRPILIAAPSILPGREHQIHVTYDRTGQPLTVTEQGWAPSIGETPAARIIRSTNYSYQTINGHRVLAKIDGPLPNGPDGTSGDSDITSVRYDDRGNHPVEIVAPGNRITKFTHFDEAGRTVVTETHDGIHQPRRTKTGFNTSGQITSIADIQNQERTRPGIWRDKIASWFNYGAGTKPLVALITRIEYDYRQRPVRVTRPDGTWQQLAYDEAGRVSSVRDQAGNSVARSADSENRILAILAKSDNPNAPLEALTQYRYDEKHRLAKMVAATGAVTSFSYDEDDRSATVVDPLKRQVLFRYDPVGSMTGAGKNQHGDTGPAELSGNAGSDFIKAANGGVHRRVRDDFGRTLLVDNPDSGQLQGQYDEADRIVRVSNANGKKTDFSYDAAGNLLQHATSGVDTKGSPDREVVEYRYEGTYLVAVKQRHQTTEYMYDANERLSQKSEILHAQTGRSSDGRRFAERYAYDAFGRLIARTLASGDVLRFSYNGAGIASTMELVSEDGKRTTPVATKIDVQPFVGVTAFTHGNGMLSGYHFERASGRLTSITVRPESAVFTGASPASSESGNFSRIDGRLQQAAPVYSQDISYDDGNRISAIARSGAGQPDRRVAKFEYDSQDRLTGVESPLQRTKWTYDSMGNRLEQADIKSGHSQKLSYGPASNQLRRSETVNGADEYKYDKAGNTIRAGKNTYLYGATGRLSQVNRDIHTVAQYTHNAGGERIAKTVHRADGSKQTTFFLYHENRLDAEVDDAGNVTAQYLYLGRFPVAKIEYQPPKSIRMSQEESAGSLSKITRWFRQEEARESQIYAIHTDHLGTPQAVTDSNQRVVWKADYTAFGRAVISVETITLNLRFPGQYFDAETQTHYNYFRDYDPDTGRYLTSDPMGVNAGLNSYAYVNANPLRSIDPFGLDSYVIGTADPAHPFDIGSGVWKSVEQTYYTRAQKISVETLIVTGIAGLLVGDDAVRHMEHFLGNTGDELTIDIARIRAEVKPFDTLYKKERDAAISFVNGLASNFLKSNEPDCKAITYDITSSIPSRSGFSGVSKDWFYAVGDYYYWGKGKTQIWKTNGAVHFTLDFTFKLSDRYNWDSGKGVVIDSNGKALISDSLWQKMHQEGYAQEYDISGSTEERIQK